MRHDAFCAVRHDLREPAAHDVEPEGAVALGDGRAEDRWKREKVLGLVSSFRRSINKTVVDAYKTVKRRNSKKASIGSFEEWESFRKSFPADS